MVKTYVNGNAGWDLANFIINPNGKRGESFEKGGRMDMVILLPGSARFIIDGSLLLKLRRLIRSRMTP